METREQILERIIYECVSLSDIMRSGIPDGERIYNEINAKWGAWHDESQAVTDDINPAEDRDAQADGSAIWLWNNSIHVKGGGK